MPRDVVRIELDGVFERSENPSQVREFNYVVSLDVIDTETGQLIMENEYRTVASDEPLSLDAIKERMTDLIETEQT